MEGEVAKGLIIFLEASKTPFKIPFFLITSFQFLFCLHNYHKSPISLLYAPH